MLKQVNTACYRHVRLPRPCRGTSPPRFENIHPAVRPAPPASGAFRPMVRPRPAVPAIRTMLGRMPFDSDPDTDSPMSGTMKFAAEDLEQIDMPAFSPPSPPLNPNFDVGPSNPDSYRSQYQPYRPGAVARPVTPPSPPRLRHRRSSLVVEAGVTKPNAKPMAQRRPLQAPPQFPTMPATSIVSWMADVQRETDYRTVCEEMLASRRYTHQEVLHHSLIMQIGDPELAAMLWRHEHKHGVHSYAPDRRNGLDLLLRPAWESVEETVEETVPVNGQKKKDRCVVM